MATATKKQRQQFDFQPLRINKSLVILALESHPEDLGRVFPDGRFASAAEAIEAMRAHPSEWIVDGILSIENS